MLSKETGINLSVFVPQSFRWPEWESFKFCPDQRVRIATGLTEPVVSFLASCEITFWAYFNFIHLMLTDFDDDLCYLRQLVVSPIINNAVVQDPLGISQEGFRTAVHLLFCILFQRAKIHGMENILCIVGVLFQRNGLLECVRPGLLHFLNSKLEQVGQLFDGQHGHGFALRLDAFCYCNLLTFRTKPVPLWFRCQSQTLSVINPGTELTAKDLSFPVTNPAIEVIPSVLILTATVQ